MSRGRRTHLRELLLLLVLAAAVIWVARLQRRHPASGAPGGLGPGPEFGRPARISFVSAADSIVVLVQGDAFTIVHPLEDRANPLFLAEVVRTVGSLKADRVLDPGDDRKYGLEGDGAGLRLSNAAGRSWVLRLGDDVPTGSLVYARVGPSPAPPVLLDLYTARKYFRPDLRTLRDPAPTSLRAGPIDSVDVLVPEREFRAARIESDLWRVRVPAGLDADPVPLNTTIRLLRDPTITDYPAPTTPLATLGLDPPRATWILFQGTRRDTVRLGYGTPDQQGIYIRPAHRPGAAIIPSEHFRNLVGGWPALIDPHLLKLPMDSVTVVEFPGRGVSFRRDAGAWRSRPGADTLAQGPSLTRDLANLAGLRWAKYVWPEVAPPADARRLSIRIATPSRAETLVLAAPSDTLAWGRSARGHHWGRIPASTWNTWFFRAEHAR